MPILTLTTDFGLKDHFAGAVKGAIYSEMADAKIVDMVDKHFDLRPGAIIENLKLQRPIYKQTAAFGHFGRSDIDLPWEITDKASIIKKEIFDD